MNQMMYQSQPHSLQQTSYLHPSSALNQSTDRSLKRAPVPKKYQHPLASSIGSYSSTSQLIKNIKDEENIRQCEQLIHELQEELPSSFILNQSKNCGNTSQFGNLSHRSVNQLRQSTSLSHLRKRSFDCGVARQNLQNQSLNFKELRKAGVFQNLQSNDTSIISHKQVVPLPSKGGHPKIKSTFQGSQTQRIMSNKRNESINKSIDQSKFITNQTKNNSKSKNILSTSINLAQINNYQTAVPKSNNNLEEATIIKVDLADTQHNLYNTNPSLPSEDHQDNKDIEDSPTLSRSKSQNTRKQSNLTLSQHSQFNGIGKTSSTILMLDKQVQSLQKENKDLRERLEQSYQMQHQLENELEEFLVQSKAKEEEQKQIKKRLQDFQKAHVNCDQVKKDLSDKVNKLEKEKTKLNEKYISLSQRLKDTNHINSQSLQSNHSNKEYQMMYQKQVEEINMLRVKIAKLEEHRKNDQIFQRFTSELVCACLHELMIELSTRMQIQGDEVFDVNKFQQFLLDQNCKECGHAELIDLELGSIIVLSCKRIKDLNYLSEELNDKLLSMQNEYQTIINQYQDKCMLLEQNLYDAMNSTPKQNTLSSSNGVFRQINNGNNSESPVINMTRKQSFKNFNQLHSMNTMSQQSHLFMSQTQNSGKENFNPDNMLTSSMGGNTVVYRNSSTNKMNIPQNNYGSMRRSQSPIDFGGTSAIGALDNSPDQTTNSRDFSMLGGMKQHPIFQIMDEKKSTKVNKIPPSRQQQNQKTISYSSAQRQQYRQRSKNM